MSLYSLAVMLLQFWAVTNNRMEHGTRMAFTTWQPQPPNTCTTEPRTILFLIIFDRITVVLLRRLRPEDASTGILQVRSGTKGLRLSVRTHRCSVSSLTPEVPKSTRKGSRCPRLLRFPTVSYLPPTYLLYVSTLPYIDQTSHFLHHQAGGGDWDGPNITPCITVCINFVFCHGVPASPTEVFITQGSHLGL